MTAEYKVHGDVAVITLNNPPVNGLGLSTRVGITDGLAKANADAAVKAIVITGAGKAFSGGADIREFGSPKALAEPNLLSVIAAVEASDKPVVAAIQATSGGPANCPIDDHCCTHPTVVATVSSLGAKRTANENKVPGMTPPMAEKHTTHRNCSAAGKCHACHCAKANNAPTPMAPKPKRSNAGDVMPRPNRRPERTLPAILANATTAVSAPPMVMFSPICA